MSIRTLSPQDFVRFLFSHNHQNAYIMEIKLSSTCSIVADRFDIAS